MKVILKEDVKNLGKMGDIVNVAEGHARNFLIPKKLAVEAVTGNIKELEHQKKVIQEKAKKQKDSAQTLSEKISSLNLFIKAKAGEEEKLFGSITSMDIAAALKNEGIDIDKKRISVEEPIKRLGSYTVGVKVHPEITTQLNITVIAE
ncbi:MAG: 50S ribosomal protein L9 [Thermodesulfovibrionales bacterium]|nr:50S ribosomal protein L9 [Thermodesulfovibrionales bacterium]